MANKIDSNVSGLAYAEETAVIGVLPGTPDWKILEPNSFNDFGGQIATVARNPINVSRQRKKGVTTDLDASGGFVTDFTQINLFDLLQGFMFADWREQPSELVTAVDLDTTNPDEYEVALTAGFQVGNLIQGSNFTNAANNTVNAVVAIVTDVSVEVLDGTLVVEASPPATAQIKVVGFEGAAGDIDVDVPGGGAKNAYTSTVLDFTTLDLVRGAWIFVGGDLAAEAFVDANNNGFKRVFSIATSRLEVDKGGESMVTEASTTETIRLFLADNLKNENTEALIKRRTYNLERTLGDNGTGVQSEYITGAVPSTFEINNRSADKVVATLGFVGIDHETRDGATGIKSGNRPALVASDAFNTSSDFTRLKLSKADGTALFAFLTEFTVTIDNGLSPNKAVSVLGAFDVTAGQFLVSGSITAYFSDIAAIKSVRDNDDISLDFALVKNNAGWTFDVPLITLGDGRANVEQDQPITIPLTTDAGADKIFDHTLLLNNFDFLPNAAG